MPDRSTAAPASLLATPGRSLGALVWDARQRHPDRPALALKDQTLTYAELVDGAARVATILARQSIAAPRLGAVFGAKSTAVYQGVLGTLLAGCGYVPLNPKFPAARSLHMLEVSAATTLVADEGFAPQADEILSGVSRPLCVVLPQTDDVADLAKRHPRHTFVPAGAVADASPRVEPPGVCDTAIAYLLFTSGSTGLPKGVMVTHRNALHYLDVIGRRYEIVPDDRFSQTFDLTFDLSVHDMFLCWGHGACLCVPSANDMMAPARFIRDRALSVWFSVPSVGILMKRLGMLKPDAFDGLRLSLFCGEPFPESVAAAWQAAAPRSRVENLYGPTEATIACTVYQFDAAKTPAQSRDGIVPIGRPLVGLTAALVDEARQLVPPGEVGELCIAGPQVAAGYWRDVEKTADKFIAMPWHDGPDNLWYCTGDYASCDESCDLVYRGRGDDQVKIRGFRVELLEIEQVLKEAAGTEFVAVLAYPRNEFGPTGTTAFVAGSSVEKDALLAAAKVRLADYMVPQDVIFLKDMPLNPNGKIDKKTLKTMLES